MEDLQVLDVTDECHLFCLQYVFQPHINASLQKFMLAWNSHPLSSEGNLSPNQLWTIELVGSNQDPFETEVSQCSCIKFNRSFTL